MLAGQLALMLAAAFTGAAFYINFAEQPARLSLDDRNLLKQWKLSYARGITMQSSLAAAAGVLGLLSAWQTDDLLCAVGAILMLANWPFTLICIKPTNNELNATPESEAGPKTRATITGWAQLHAIRTALGFAATVVLLWASL